MNNRYIIITCSEGDNVIVGPCTQSQYMMLKDIHQDTNEGMLYSFDKWMEETNQPKFKIERQRVSMTVRIWLTADDWQLYSSEKFAEDRETIAAAMNSQIENILHIGGDGWSDIWNACMDVLDEYRRHGAADTEGRTVLRHLLADLGCPVDRD